MCACRMPILALIDQQTSILLLAFDVVRLLRFVPLMWSRVYVCAFDVVGVSLNPQCAFDVVKEYMHNYAFDVVRLLCMCL